MLEALSPKRLAKWLEDGKWDEPQFQIGDTTFQVQKIGALTEDEILDDILEALGMSSVEQLRFLLMGDSATKAVVPVLESVQVIALIKMFLSIPKAQKRALRDRMFAHITYQNPLTNNAWKPMRGSTARPGQPDMEEEAFAHLRGPDVQVVFYRSLWVTFRESFSNLA